MSTPTQQATNVQQAIADLLYENWPLQGALDAENIQIKGYEEQPNQHFREGNNYAIEITAISGTSISQAKRHTKMNDLYRIDIFLKFPDVSPKSRIEGEDQRMQIINAIWDILHDNQTDVTGLKIITLTRWIKKDELKESPIVLSNSLFITGQWYHRSST